MKAGFLSTAALAAAANVEEWKRRFGPALSRETPQTAPFLPAGPGGCDVIAEVKMESPSRGNLMAGSDPLRLAELYQETGAEAVSVVVEEKHFGGSPELFVAVREKIDLPLLWKDFVIDPYQVRLAAALGASAVLLIVGLIPDHELIALVESSRDLGLTALVEIHGEDDLGSALSADADIVGVNNRDLVSLEVDTSTSKRVAPLFPPGLRTVAESGIKRSEDVGRMAGYGYRAVLVGEALVTADDTKGLLEKMVEAGKNPSISDLTSQVSKGFTS